MLNDEIKKIKDKKIAIKKIRTSFEERKMRGQAKILNWMAKLKIFISNYKWIQNKKNQENEDQIKKKIKIIDLKMKLKINWNLIKGLIIKIRNQNIEAKS